MTIDPISRNIAPMIRAFAVILFFSSLDVFAADNVMNLRAQLINNLVKKIREQPEISFKNLVEFANAQEPVSVRVTFKNFTSDFYSRNACGNVEAELPVVDFDQEKTRIKTADGLKTFSRTQAEPTTIRWGSKVFLAAGPFAPYRLNMDKKTLNFIFPFPRGSGIGPQVKWWQELVEHLPILAIEEFPYLVVESTSKGLRFPENFEAYQRSQHKEVRATHSELATMPFSKIFFYPNENQRIQVPQTCN